jgi:hypothetical protein
VLRAHAAASAPHGRHPAGLHHRRRGYQVGYVQHRRLRVSCLLFINVSLETRWSTAVCTNRICCVVVVAHQWGREDQVGNTALPLACFVFFVSRLLFIYVDVETKWGTQQRRLHHLCLLFRGGCLFRGC